MELNGVMGMIGTSFVFMFNGSRIFFGYSSHISFFVSCSRIESYLEKLAKEDKMPL